MALGIELELATYKAGTLTPTLSLCPISLSSLSIFLSLSYLMLFKEVSSLLSITYSLSRITAESSFTDKKMTAVK